ncbi:ankyrin repeat-containing domain protein, partial [Syncephalis pseudoplumigaleata]
MIIDDESHTALHWAAATARIKLVHLLLQRGASMNCLSDHGETPLTRSVQFSNNFELKTFPDLLEALQRTVTVRDDHGRTVMHHVALTAGSRGKVHAARYYMDCLLEMLTRTLKSPSSVIDLQDKSGDTALHIAARIGNRIMVRRLLDAGAAMNLRN